MAIVNRKDYALFKTHKFFQMHTPKNIVEWNVLYTCDICKFYFALYVTHCVWKFTDIRTSDLGMYERKHCGRDRTIFILLYVCQYQSSVNNPFCMTRYPKFS